MKYTLDFNRLEVNLGAFFDRKMKHQIMAAVRMNAPEARPSQYNIPLEMPLSGHFMNTEGWVIVHQTENS